MARKSIAKDRKGKPSEADKNTFSENLAAFTLPDSLPCSEVSFPVLMRKRHKANWKAILAERDEHMSEIEAYMTKKNPPPPKAPFMKTEADYIKDKVFKYLLPAVEETLIKAKMWDSFVKQNCFFNGIDHIAQVLWNNNPRHPNRNAQYPNRHIFNMPWVREWLKDHPRAVYPKSWLWTEDHAATIIQKTVRQYFVQREDECQEMRTFWRKLKLASDYMSDIEVNKMLAKRFATMPLPNKSDHK